MTEPQNDDDETKFNETLKRMLKTPPKPHKPKDEADAQDKKLDRAGRGPHASRTD